MRKRRMKRRKIGEGKKQTCDFVVKAKGKLEVIGFIIPNLICILW